MRFVKGISLFFFYPALTFVLGIYAGVAGYHFFYPGEDIELQEQTPHVITREEPEYVPETLQMPQPESALETIKKGEVLTSETEYVLREVDVRKGTCVETVWDVPARYLGMNRETFVDTLEDYAASPPLQELERGFVGLEVVSFSGERVVVEMRYAYVEPSDSFYLCVENNYVTVYLEDKETVYLNTDILLEALPEELQHQIMGYLFIEEEQELYNFLESYSS